MNRRDFLKYLLATPIAAELDIEKLLWVPEKLIFIPSPAQIKFLEDWKTIPLMFGIPYHYTDASTGTWLGFTRADVKTKLDR